MTYVVCPNPECHNGRATVNGNVLSCPDGHKFKLVRIKRRKEK